MRETDVIVKRLVGDKEKSAGYIGVARTLLGRMQSYLGPGVSGARLWRLRDGTLIRTLVAGTQRIVEIITSGECRPLLKKLFGFTCVPASEDTPLGFRDIETPDVDHPDFPWVGVEPVTPEPPDEDAYVPSYYNKAHIPVGIEKFSTHRKRIIDTCNNIGDWFPNGLRAGNIDWRGLEGEVLSWQFGWCRYRNFRATSDSGLKVPVLSGLALRVGHIFRFAGNIRQPYVTIKVKAIPVVPLTDINVDTYIDTVRGVLGTLYHNAKPLMNNVTGACLKKVGDEETGFRYKLLVVGYTVLDSNESIAEERVSVADFNINTSTVSNMVTLTNKSWPDISFVCSNTSPWLFNASGTKAVSNRSHSVTIIDPPTTAHKIEHVHRQWDLDIDWSNPDLPVATFTDTSAVGVYDLNESVLPTVTDNTEFISVEYLDGGCNTHETQEKERPDVQRLDAANRKIKQVFFRDFVDDTLVYGSFQEIVNRVNEDEISLATAGLCTWPSFCGADPTNETPWAQPDPLLSFPGVTWPLFERTFTFDYEYRAKADFGPMQIDHVKTGAYSHVLTRTTPCGGDTVETIDESETINDALDIPYIGVAGADLRSGFLHVFQKPVGTTDVTEKIFVDGVEVYEAAASTLNLTQSGVGLAPEVDASLNFIGTNAWLVFDEEQKDFVSCPKYVDVGSGIEWFNYLTGADPAVVTGITGDEIRFTNIGVL